MYICNCHGITEDRVREVARHTCFAYANLSTTIRVHKNSCCRCLPDIKEAISDEKSKGKPTK